MPQPKPSQTANVEQRRGAVRRVDIPPDVLERLNAGQIESKTLVECLAIDFGVLFRSVAPDAGESAGSAMDSLTPLRYTLRMERAAQIVAQYYGSRAVERFGGHPSDTVRCWAAGSAAALPGDLPERLRRLRPFADDANSGVREWAWIFVRPALAAELPLAIRLLCPWTADPLANLRRFAVEALRPRGVWCRHIEPLKQNPQPAVPLLEPLKSDPARYVQLSVGNWLNDASKSRPDWVRDLTQRWLEESDTGSTRWIVNHALRTLRKQA